MNENIKVQWGDRDFVATQTEFRVTGKVKKDGEHCLLITSPLGLSVDGRSAHIGGNADVSIQIHLSRDMIYDLFERAMQFEGYYNPKLARIGKALVKELRSEG